MELVSVIKKVPQCNVSLFKRKPELFKHIVIVCDLPIKYKCTICNKSFASKSNCSYHKNCLNDSLKPYECSVCNRRFTSKSHYEYHMYSHEGENPYKCSKCSKSFRTNRKLLRHEEVHAEKRETYPCSKCQKTFLGETSLKNHLRSHTGKKRFQCDHCSKTFSEKKNLIHHLNSLNGVKNYVCEICGSSFVVKWNLELHRRTHSATRSFKCPISGCSTTFLQKRYLNRHMELHKNTAKYECEICHQEFRRKDNLRRHFHRHLEERDSSSKQAEQPSEAFVLREDSITENGENGRKLNERKSSERINQFEGDHADVAAGFRRESVIKSVPAAVCSVQVSVIKDGRKETAKVRSFEVDSGSPEAPQLILSSDCVVRNRSVIEQLTLQNLPSSGHDEGIPDQPSSSLLHSNTVGEKTTTTRHCYIPKKMIAASYMHGLLSDSDVANSDEENRCNLTRTNFAQSNVLMGLRCYDDSCLDLSMKSHEESFY